MSQQENANSHINEIKFYLLKESVESYKQDYSETISQWKDLEQKAQNLISLSGIFIAAIYAFIRQAPDGQWSKALIGLAMLSFLWVIAFCIACVYLKEVTSAPYTKRIPSMVADLLALENDVLSARYIDFFHSQCKAWEETNESHRTKLAKKVTYLLLAYGGLAFALIFVVVLTLTILF